MSCVFQAIKLLKPDKVIQIGDMVEAEKASHWQYKRRKRPPLEYQLAEIDKEVSKALKAWDKLDAAIPEGTEKIMCLGNHDMRYNYLVEENPFIPEYGFEALFNTTARGWKVMPYGKLVCIDGMHYYHGIHVVSMYHARNHLVRYGVSVIYGHSHDIQSASVQHARGVISAHCIGVLKKMDLESNQWLDNRPHRWSQCFATVDIIGKDHLVTIYPIMNGKCVVGGTVLKG